MPNPAAAADEKLAQEEADRLGERHRGVMAKQLLTNPLLVAAFDAIEAEAIKGFRTSSGPNGLQIREASYLALKTLDWVKQNITEHVRTGELAELALPGIEAKRKTLRERLNLRRIA